MLLITLALAVLDTRLLIGPLLHHPVRFSIVVASQAVAIVILQVSRQ